MSQNKYDSHIKPRLIEIAAWARDGVAESEISIRLDVSYSKFRLHKAEKKELAEALKMTKEITDIMVENALLKRALGFEVEEKTYQRVKDKETGRTSEVLVERKVKKNAGDFSAQKLWLENRKRSAWGPEAQSGGTVTDGKVVINE